MKRMFEKLIPASTLALPLFAIGCSNSPGRVDQIYIDTSAAASKAMELFDANGDGEVDKTEIEKSPGLMSGLERIDTDKNGTLSEAEISAKIDSWKQTRTALTGFRCAVSLDGQPLTDADITFEPEAFLGAALKPGSGRTNSFGESFPSLKPEDRPDPKLPGGMPLALYRIKVSKVVNGKETLPAKYNSETELGADVSYDNPEIQSMLISLPLKSGK